MRPAVTVLAVVGLALFFGDGLITPAISVLSAVEGLETAAPALGRFVVPIAAVVLVALFLIQRRGTASVGGSSARSWRSGSRPWVCWASSKSCTTRAC